MFDVEAAREALTPMDWASPASPQGVLRDYVRFYGLDFGGRVTGLRHGIGVFTVNTSPAAPEPGSYRIAVQLFHVEKPRGTVLLLHGYYDHVGIFAHVIEHLLAQGLDVVTFDLPGHGLSSGERAAIRSFSEYQYVLDAVFEGLSETRLVVPLHAVAQSTGGAILVEWLLRSRATVESSPFASVVTFAPLVRPVNWGVNRLLYYVIRLFRDSIARKFAINSHDEEFRAFLREKDPLQSHELSVRWVGALKNWIPKIENASPCEYPLVIVQGDEDATVDWRHNLVVLREKFPRASIRIVGTGRHQLVNESRELREKAYAAMDEERELLVNAARGDEPERGVVP